MNPEEEIIHPVEQRGQEPILDKQHEVISLSAESRVALEELRRELENLQNLLSSPETQKIPFTMPGGEQDLGRQMATLQKERIPQIFKDTEFESPHLSTHDVQTEQYSCQFATVANILKALGISITEKEVATEVSKTGKTANIWPEELSEYLENKGLDVSRVGSILEAIDALVKGGKIILPLVPPKYPISHAVAISGIKIKNGKIEFYINDPQYKNHAETVLLDDIVDMIISYSFHKMTPAYSVSRKNFGEDVSNE